MGLSRRGARRALTGTRPQGAQFLYHRFIRQFFAKNDAFIQKEIGDLRKATSEAVGTAFKTASDHAGDIAAAATAAAATAKKLE